MGESKEDLATEEDEGDEGEEESHRGSEVKIIGENKGCGVVYLDYG